MKIHLTNPDNKTIVINVDPNKTYMYEYFDNLHKDTDLTDVDTLDGNCLQYNFNIGGTKIVRVWEKETNKEIYRYGA